MTYVRWRVIILSVRLQIIGIFSQVTCAPLISNHGSMDVGRKRSGFHGFRAVCARVASVALWYVNCTWSTRKSAGIPLDEPFFSQREIFVIVCVGLCDHYLESREKHDWVWYFTFVSLKGKKYLICKSKKKNQFIIFKQYVDTRSGYGIYFTIGTGNFIMPSICRCKNITKSCFILK